MGANCCTDSDPMATQVESVKDEPAHEPVVERQEEVALVLETEDKDAPMISEPEREEPPTEEPVKEEPAGLVCRFLSEEGLKDITFTEKPVGMKFDKKAPIVINGLTDKGKAKDLGVKIGWELKSIGGASLEGCEKYEDAMAIILKELETLPEPAGPTGGLVLGFLSDEGVKYITFTEKPVGMKFDKKAPIVINGFNEKSKAKDLGVKIGWELKSIGGASLEGFEKYEDAMAVILKKIQTLPEAS